MLDQLVHAAPDSRVRLPHDGAEIGFYRRRIAVHPPAVAPFLILWRGERELALPHGTLEFTRCSGGEPDCVSLERQEVSVRLRVGGERIRLALDRPRRALKSILRDARMPPWQRESLPLVFCGDALAAVPGIGVDTAFQAPAGTPGYSIRWYRTPSDATGVRTSDADQQKDWHAMSMAGHNGGSASLPRNRGLPGCPSSERDPPS
jgi:tRNA(Ile)-lysidine synthase